MTIEIIGPEAEAKLDWIELTEAIEAGHRLPRAEVGDTVLRRGEDTLLTRSAWIDGMGLAVKAATIYPGNQTLGLPNLHGVVALFSDREGLPEAYLDFALVTKWKTAADSLLAARRLARPDAEMFLLVGAGTVASSMVEAYSAAFPKARFHVWTRTPESARAFADATGATPEPDLEAAVRKADVIATATMATEPMIRGEWLKPGTHLDLIGAYRPDMREVNDDVMKRARIFVDARATTIRHIGEIMAPLASGAITEGDILGDFYDIASGDFVRGADDEITLCKNGGGAHLDLMTARYILDTVKR
ncbi:Delta(1)-pyrroline-2-carboxylate reductase [Defluviimonas aquaemixtae]|uniref:Delta(1)-pyrroline-2-carboxylate reductase n=1 Tax=Albidovulum aquaemixtae TaxID=1542388 RepID=A0A2R8B293_9RHOB|nr:NAD(P)-binding domain-containing protein [Defluviimonas aquaemixtae]SPH16697.1 Delta(1)-pyrroline-2-carboxylate reductase [Defluviimonas aquaemixtae]